MNKLFFCAAGLVLLASACGSSGGGNGQADDDGDDDSTQGASSGSLGGVHGDGGAAGIDETVPRIVADTNRNGAVDLDDPTENTDKTTWDAKHGAIFLANIDDDASACKSTSSTSDVDLPDCNDGADTVLNGDSDALDLAPLATAPLEGAAADATGTLAVDDAAAPYVHLFVQRDGALTYFDWKSDQLTADEVKSGATLAIEATDIVRDTKVWNGEATVTYSVGTQHDAVLLRVAPVVTQHHLSQVTRAYATQFSGDPGSSSFTGTLKDGFTKTGHTADDFFYEINGSGNVYDDQWTQDFFETAYMSMPTAQGQHVIDVFYRSANVYSNSAKSPLRTAGKVVFTKFRGPDAAGVSQYDAKHDQDMDSLNSFGNLETIPPYTLGDKSYPLGRLFRGSIPTFHPDPTFMTMLESQAVQPPVYVDTSWLLVGHVDETISFVKTSTPRGWAVLVNDATLAKQMLQDQVAAGNGAVTMFAGRNWVDDNGNEVAAEISIDDVLADDDVMTESAKSAASVDSQLAILRTELGLEDSEIIRIPYLHQPVQGYSLAYQPGTVNGLYVDDTFMAPDPHGPVIDGKDIMKTQFETALGAVGVQVVWIEDWDLYHRLAGEVHCGSNVRRAVGDATWWNSGY